LLRLARDANASLSAPVEERPDFRVTRAGRTVEPALLPIRRAALGEEVRDDELEVVFPDGTALTILAHATPLRDAAGQTIGAVCAGLDITARKQTEQELRELNETLEERVATEMKSRQQAEAALRQAQKMEAIGQLTGGVAHDFNNLLMVIQGNLETLDRYLASTLVGNRERFDRPVRSALRGVERAAALTHRLLAFARRQPLAPDPLEPDRLVAGMSDLLRRTLGESVAIDIVSANGLWRIFADPNQLENALLNLAVNARDAMPQGGRLVIETANTRLDETYVSANQEVIPGDYVMFAVTDTGTGMSKEASEKAFEPFFTTKEIGRGTGLGLSQVYGFVKQSGGHVKIYSEVGEGTTVRLYLPRYTAAGEERDTHGEAAAAAPVTGSETILVVEDDGDVRANSVSTLRELGYRVLEAPNGAAALQVLSREPAVRLLFTDVGLPDGMNGRQLAEAARERVPGLKVLFTTGYAQNAILHNGRLDRDVELIVKPYTFAALAAKIRSVLEAQRQGA
jgi:signal transduction histidine kinase